MFENVYVFPNISFQQLLTKDTWQIQGVTNSRGSRGFITWVCEFEIQKPTNPHFQAA